MSEREKIIQALVTGEKTIPDLRQELEQINAHPAYTIEEQARVLLLQDFVNNAKRQEVAGASERAARMRQDIVDDAAWLTSLLAESGITLDPAVIAGISRGTAQRSWYRCSREIRFVAPLVSSAIDDSFQKAMKATIKDVLQGCGTHFQL
jgi:hypothetical protein